MNGGPGKNGGGVSAANDWVMSSPDQYGSRDQLMT
jgi:hypothetical protein